MNSMYWGHEYMFCSLVLCYVKQRFQRSNTEDTYIYHKHVHICVTITIDHCNISVLYWVNWRHFVTIMCCTILIIVKIFSCKPASNGMMSQYWEIISWMCSINLWPQSQLKVNLCFWSPGDHTSAGLCTWIHVFVSITTNNVVASIAFGGCIIPGTHWPLQWSWLLCSFHSCH